MKAIESEEKIVEAEGNRTNYVFNFYCCVTNYCQSSGLKEPTFIISIFMPQNLTYITWFLCSRLQSRCQLSVFFSGDMTRERPTSKLSPVGRIYFPVIVGLRSH